jgi:hypothetical protein
MAASRLGTELNETSPEKLPDDGKFVGNSKSDLKLPNVSKSL